MDPPTHSTDTHLSWAVGGWARQRTPSSAGMTTARPKPLLVKIEEGISARGTHAVIMTSLYQWRTT